jgi:hypothetical protein
MVRIGFTGGRNYNNRQRVEHVFAKLVDHYGTDFVVVHGNAAGLDRLVNEISLDFGVQSKEAFPAQWSDLCDPTFCSPNHRRRRRDGSTYCPAAGPRRNQEMVDSGLGLVVAFDGGTGTADMMRRSHRVGITIWRIADE